MPNLALKKIAIIGNGGGGKTTLSRRLGELHGVPVTHVDTIQFVAGMNVRPLAETRAILGEITAREKWLIDGFGPLDMIDARFEKAERVIFVDFPLWRHYWWCTKRQVKSLWSPRRELVEGCNEATIKHTIKLFKTLWKVHYGMKPELMKIFNRASIAPKMIYIRSLKDWNRIYRAGLD